MTDTELNDLLYELEYSGYSGDEIHDAIVDIEKTNKCAITDFEQLEACIKIVRWIEALN